MKRNICKSFLVKFATLFMIALLSTASTAIAEPLKKIKERGFIEIAVYERFLPYSYEENGQPKGVDVEIGKALAEKLGLKPKFRLFQLDESADDDLRNHVWKGHPINGAPADIMLHVPTHPAFAKENEQAKILSPYFREIVVVARYPRLKHIVSVAHLGNERIGAEKLTLASDYLASALSGLLRNNMALYPSVSEAIEDMKTGKVTAVMGQRGEIEGFLGANKDKFVVGPLAMPGLPYDGWDLGVAVKATHTELAAAVDQAMAELQAEGTIKRIFEAYGLTYTEPKTKLVQQQYEDQPQRDI
ncbi:MAG: transporter substrate-binding domain-containing protein [Deltaproteobacteria bacterium]|jgi:ABC-type amino acid transport substrate-binding protein|nr:transporter substrate-binding domain-containing protein [Deltaproteobacteria bacterium]MBW2476093.1 transporter substrate-binding domain-containing protein [Deltaproteobacteria bacterium]MBW2504114.1 transporter substrate-binding domain-containing protein [Deltaproteobacteria bacterium]MBW2519705.1 transporter substrate-binding domain-containing protein [Deltaproteobacteria bacterium]